MIQIPGVGPTPEEPSPNGRGEDHGWRALIALVELFVLMDDSSPTIVVTAGLLWALYLLSARKHQ
jgi:hypothetical protein